MPFFINYPSSDKLFLMFLIVKVSFKILVIPSLCKNNTDLIHM